MSIPAKKIYPRTGDKQTVYLDAVVKDPSISVGPYTMYNDFVNDPVDFEKNNVLYHYPINGDGLVIGKFCSIACGAKFIFTSANHTLSSLSTYPFPLFYEEWDTPISEVATAWDNKGDIVVGSDVWVRGGDPVRRPHRRRGDHRHEGRCYQRCGAIHHRGRRTGQADPEAL